MARKTSLLVILTLVQKTKWPPYHMFKVHHVFAYTLISHSFIMISSPNLQAMFMAMKTCLLNFTLILKNKMAAIANCLKIIKVL